MEDEVDIYGDLDPLGDDQLEISPEVARELRQENSELQRKIEELSNELERVNKYSKSLEANISSLHKTAQVEIARKDRMITDLRQQLDNAAFRRNTNFRIPRKTPKPVVISLPPKDESTCTEIKKEEVNDTIKKEETNYVSPLGTNQDDDDDTQQVYQPDKIPVTIFGERLRRKLEQESREQAEKAAAKAQQPLDLDTPPQQPPNIDIIENEDDKDNQYRLIPLTLQKLAENSRKRGSDSLERSDESKSSEKPDYHRTRASNDNKRRRIDDNKSRRDKSPNGDGHKNSIVKSEDRKRMEIKAEYCCPGENVRDEMHAKRRHEDKVDSHGSSRHQKPQSHGSRSRSRSRERRDRKESRRDTYSSLNRIKENRVLSKSPSRRHDSEKIDKYSSSQRGNDRHGEKRRVTLRDSKESKRLIRKCASPAIRIMDLRRRLNGRNDGRAKSRTPNGIIRIKSEMRRRPRSDCDTSKNHRRENSRETLRNSHVSKCEMTDRKRGTESKIDVNEQKKLDRNRNEKSKSPSTEIIKQNLVDDKMKIQEPKKCDEIATPRDNQHDSLDDMEEGEIPDSPSHTSENQTPSSTTDRIDTEMPESQNLDDSVKEEKIENIEMFIEKMQERDKNDSSGVNHNIVKRNLNIMKKQINQTDWSSKTDIILGTLERSTSDESVHLTSILGDSSDEEVHKSDDKTTHVNKVEKRPQKTATAHNDSNSLNNLMHKEGSNQLETANTTVSATLSMNKVPEKLSHVLSKGEMEKSKNTMKSSGCSETAKERDNNVEITKTCPKLFEALQGPRPILHEISSPLKVSIKSNEIHEKKSVPKQKENSVKTSGPPAGRIVVARRRKIKLSNSSTSMTVVMSDRNTVKKQ